MTYMARMIRKRNGELEKFNIHKILNAVTKAYVETRKVEPPMTLLGDVREWAERARPDDVESVQDGLETLLMDGKYHDVAKAFILYRSQHAEDRFLQSRIDYMDGYSMTLDSAAQASETDANANVTMKNVANLEGEVWKATNRRIQRRRMRQKLKEMYPEVADQYVKDLESHVIYVNDEATSPEVKPYCSAVTLYPLMLEGAGNIDGVTPSPPNDINSFSGQVTNLLFLLSSQVKGAVALGDYFVAFNYYVIAEFGDDWHERVDDVITSGKCLHQKTIRDAIRKGFKQFIYGANQPAGNRSYNSPFSNLSFYDSVYFNSMFGEFYYPDGTRPKWEAIDKLQRIFMELHRELRLIKPLTFPVTTMAMVHDGKDMLDKEYKELCADEWAKGGSFFVYINDSPTALASCCFHPDTKVLWKNSHDGVKCTTLRELHDLNWEPCKKNLRIYHNGSWVKGKTVKLPMRPLYKVITMNNKEFIMTDNHVNVTYDGEKSTDQLTANDYLMFNTKPLEAIRENDEGLSYEQGLLVGLFIGDGTFGSYVCLDGSVHDFMLSLNESKWEKVKEPLSVLGEFRLRKIHNNVYPVSCHSKELTTFLAKWTTNEPRETRAFNKKLNINCVTQSKEFRQGILDGWYITDGGNSNRCYTISKDLVDAMEILCTSLGKQCVINMVDRTDEQVVIRGNSYNRNYPLYCLRWYDGTNTRTRPESGFKWKNNSVYWKIRSIEPYDDTCDNVYCVQCQNDDEPYFTLPSGLITHNCRVLNEMQENTFSSTIGLTGVMTGSVNVITLDLNRIVQDWKQENDVDYHDSKRGLRPYLANILERVYKYHIAYKTMVYDLEDKGMYANSSANYIYVKKLYSTIGLLGYCEAAEFLGFKVDNNDDYKEFIAYLFGVVKEQNKLHSIRDKKRPFLFNSEAVPGENMAVRFYEWDKADGYVVPADQNLYSSYFFKQWDPDISVLDKIKLHGAYVNKSTDGGQACHVHLQEHLSKEQYLKLIDVAIKEGCNYWTYNIPITECKGCGHVVNAPVSECPKCGGHDLDYWVRIIGFLRPLSTYSDARMKEARTRVLADANGNNLSFKDVTVR